jgi:outer membrane immunogenic protein
LLEEISVKHITLAATGLALIALSSAAVAADMSVPPRVYTKAPVLVDPGYNWTGFYAGLNGGYNWGKADAVFLPGTAFTTPVKQDVNGGLGGGQIGYNWQLDRTWVVGLEADIQGTGERGRATSTPGVTRLTLPGGDFNLVATTSAASSWSFPWFATFRGRVGLLATPDLLLYGTGGLAVGEVKYSTQTSTTAQVFGPGSQGTTPSGAAVTVAGTPLSESQTRVGWTLGAGLEKKFDRNWSAKLEYLYLDLGSKSYFAGTANQTDVSFHDHIFRAGINYAFNPAVVAKY